jgi:hypothetical protein
MADWAFTFNTDGSVAQAAGATLTFWDSLVAGNQYPAAPLPGGVDDGTGLLDGTGVPISTVTCDGNGEIPDAISGPDGIYRMAADGSGTGSGPRRWISANDMGDDLTTLFGDTAAIPALLDAPVYVYYDTTAGTYPARPGTAAVVWWVGPAAPPAGGAGSALATDGWLNTTGVPAPTGVLSVTAGDASVTVGGSAAAPTLAAGTPDQIFALHPPAAAVNMGGQKLTNGQAGTAGSDFATVSQLTSTSGQAALAPTTVKTAAYTAAGQDFVLVSTASAAVTITLPTAPADKVRVGVKLVIQSGANAVTVSTGGSDRFDVAGGTAAKTLSRLNQTITVQYQSSAGLWITQDTDTALSPDATAADIQPTGTAASAGGTAAPTKVAYPDHVHVQNYGGIFGDGSDGAVAFDGTAANTGFATTTGTAPNLAYTLIRDVFGTSITIGSGISVTPAGYRFFAKGVFTSAGTVTVNGNNGGNGGTAAASTGSGTLGAGRNGGAGTTTAGAGGIQGGPASGTGGTGGNGTGSNTGAAGGVTNAAGTTSLFRGGPAGLLAGEIQYGNANAPLYGGASGGGGGGDGTNKGGGGGGGGGVIGIMAWAVTNTGTFTATGGNGGSPPAGNAGGGGGGCGGLVLAYTLTAWTQGTVLLAGGTGGTAAGTGTAGGAGQAGHLLNVVLT